MKRSKKGWLLFVHLLIAIGFLAGLAFAISINRYPIEMLYLIGMLSIFTILVYGRDKLAALTGRWRTSENTLHLLSFIGGWPGALLGQALFNHKTSKQPFRQIFWICVISNLAFIAWTFTSNGEYFLYSQIWDIKQALSEVSVFVR
ncbi:DUF1294 domain-containing protein [Microbulbifer agarilyticus]|uniref:DUF1294 domain-containing protein n=1 Tax=Microbulbifer agarilyticus TaxID=260552 RepID=UPI001C97C0B9|nr:DUF1294 domain-containing protein [Microbulbifer agarilyticus]MBY6209928.1 DUF1294 domain-containing protein [Microbulbifer agarilyticus]